MKILTFITFIVIATSCFSQDNNLIKIAFKDKSNFDITKSLDNKKPTVYYVMNKTETWNTCRFYIDQDLSSETVKRNWSLMNIRHITSATFLKIQQ